jgi:hypothetical protein
MTLHRLHHIKVTFIDISIIKVAGNLLPPYMIYQTGVQATVGSNYQTRLKLQL